MKKVSLAGIGFLIASFLGVLGNLEAATYNTTTYLAQNKLKELGYDPGPLDGYWGSKTGIAVKGFQRDKGLSVTGELNEETKEKLGLQEAVASLLFYYSPTCSHCAWQRPEIQEFQEKHPEVEVIWREVGSLNRNEERLIGGTSGHPIMVFFEGKSSKKIVGETDQSELEKHLVRFQKDLKKSQATGTSFHSEGGSYRVCP